MNDEDAQSLSDEATFAGAKPKRPRDDLSLGDERTLGGGDGVGLDTVIDDIEVVDLLARYAIEGSLGQGGMGAVLLATDKRLGRKVAIKRILGEAARSKTAIARFLTEARAIAAISHPNVVQIYELGVAKDGPFLVIEYIDGGSLLDLCKAGPIPLGEAVAMVCDVCEGLARAHDAGIVHRDIKPANILLTKDGTPKLTDFGLAKADVSDHQMTMAGAVMGTPDFMPPEQRRDAALVDHRSDLWSLAATLYQAVSGRSPKVIRLHDLPQELQPIVSKALEEEKEARYQSAKELCDALKGIGVGGRKRAPPAKFEGGLQEGQCKACGTVTSDLTKKFCRNPQCGASLRVACLKCDAQIPVWDGVCGECGGNQPTLLEARRTRLAARREQATSLLTALAFDQAIAEAEAIRSEQHSDLAEFSAWAEGFLSSAKAEQVRQTAMAAERLREAEAHVAAWDYSAAIHVLDLIPESVRSRAAVSLREESQRRKTESESLIATVADRINRKEFEGLLAIVERAVALRGDRKDLVKIRGQLTERRDGRLARARAAFSTGDARAAAAALATATIEDFGKADRGFVETIRRAAEMERQLGRLVTDAKADSKITPQEAATILEASEACLAVNPRSEKIRALASQCRPIAEPVLREQRFVKGTATRDDIVSRPPLRNSIGIEFKLLPTGTFTMGRAGDLRDENPHQVALSRPYYLGVVEVTNAQWKAVMGSVPSKCSKANDHPVESVSWKDAMEFCRRLSALVAEQQAGHVYRLPTEAEWEYACRAGTETWYSFGDDESQLDDYAWFDTNSGYQTHPVGKKEPNAWGLFDMHGNVWEWCSDWYGKYPKDAVTDPQGPSGGSVRINRGGSWDSTASSCTSTSRRGGSSSNHSAKIGFRLALTPSGAQPPHTGK